MLKNLILIILLAIIVIIILKYDSSTNNVILREDFTTDLVKQELESPNKLYYGTPCQYIRNDAFYTALKNNGYTLTEDMSKACLLVPCTYDDITQELEKIKNNNLEKNIFGSNVRIYMINNTDYLVSKVTLWTYIVEKYCEKLASQVMPYTWYIASNEGFEKFKKEFTQGKLYISKNNHQRQEGLEIQDNIDNIDKTRDKYLIVQELLQNPYCINGRKINLRIYCLLVKDTRGNIKILLYNDGFMYYTSELFEKNSKDFKKNITTGYIDRKVYEENPLTHQDFRKYLDSERQLTNIERFIKQSRKLSEYVFEKIYAQLKMVLVIFIDKLGDQNDGISFQLYGADIAIDESLKPLLMEINKGPDLTFKDERDGKLKTTLATDMLKCIGLVPNMGDNGFITVYERAFIDNTVHEIEHYPK